jgi:hypothetical protein
VATPFSTNSDVEILGAYNRDGTYFTERRGTLASGKRRSPRYAIEIRSQPLLHNFDDMMLGAGPANKLAEVIQAQGRGIAEHASESTQEKRRLAQIAMASGRASKWLMERYAGGRIGALPPNQTQFKFNDSGRLWKSIAVRQNKTDRTFTVNVAANRLRPEKFESGAYSFQNMMADLVRLVPALNPANAAKNRDIENSIRDSIRDMIQKAEDVQAAKLKQLAMARRQAALQLLGEWFPGATSVIRGIIRFAD